MMIKFFFLAAASALLMAFNAVQTQLKIRAPSSTEMLGELLKPGVTTTYSYADINTTFEAAMVNENIHRQNAEMLQGMLASEQARYEAARADIRNIHTIASPYNPISRQIQKIKDQILRVKIQRERNLDTAYQRLFLTYSSIQMPPRDGRPGLTEAQHIDARRKIEYVATLKSAIHNEGTGIYKYPSYDQPYLTAGIFGQDLLSAPVIPAPKKVVDPVKPEVVEVPVAVAEPQEAPTPEGMVEAVPEDEATISH